MQHWDVVVVGSGPAGLMAAARAAQRGRRTILLEKNREPGVKILLSGGTRCNLTHDADARGVVEAFGPAGRFLHSALASLGPQQVVELFEAEGVPTKIEPGGKVFPASDRAADVRNALVRRTKAAGCTLALSESLVEIARLDQPSLPSPTCGRGAGGEGNRREEHPRQGFRLVTSLRSIEAEKVVLATGGQSYPACGTTGDGYRWAADLGHRIVAPHTALVPITSHAPWVLALQGITLPDVAARIIDPDDAGRCLADRRGALLFAHFGVTGPVVLDVSHAVSGHARPTSLLLRCDLLPDVKTVELERLLINEQSEAGRRRVATLLDAWLPHRVGEAVVAQSGTPPELPLGELSKARRHKIAETVKQLDIPVAGTMGFRKAEVTAGGVALDEIDSRTMQSRLVPNLYIVGELLDLNGPVGGYNFQAAFSTGWQAGESV